MDFKIYNIAGTKRTVIATSLDAAEDHSGHGCFLSAALKHVGYREVRLKGELICVEGVFSLNGRELGIRDYLQMNVEFSTEALHRIEDLYESER